MQAKNADIAELYDHLILNSPFFALWILYKRRAIGSDRAQGWSEFILRELGDEDEDIEYAQAQPALDRVLEYFQTRHLPLPPLALERIWFLHYLRGAERAAQTKAILISLAEGMEPCTSA